jgi:hypothetical protein
MPGQDGRPPGTVVAEVPRLFVAPQLRTTLVADHLVILDLAAGAYLILDEIATVIWGELLRPAADRDVAAIAERFGAPTSVVAADVVVFADQQMAAGRLSPHHGDLEPALAAPAPRRRPSLARAWWERARADRDLRRGFSAAYRSRTDPPADPVNPDARAPVDSVVATFAAAENLYPTPAAPLDCLPRSLALTRFLRTSGWPAEHVIGVAMYPFKAHAWVEVNGTPIRQGSTFVKRFTVIQRA